MNGPRCARFSAGMGQPARCWAAWEGPTSCGSDVIGGGVVVLTVCLGSADSVTGLRVFLAGLVAPPLVRLPCHFVSDDLPTAGMRSTARGLPLLLCAGSGLA